LNPNKGFHVCHNNLILKSPKDKTLTSLKSSITYSLQTKYVPIMLIASQFESK
jgi:hypothetical protein